ncbi:MAG: response regulator [Gemmataceae bacterium]|nr:response regulator [Gemmataceae bacterium]
MNPSTAETNGATTREASFFRRIEAWLAQGAFESEPTPILADLAGCFDAQAAGFSLPDAAWPLYVGGNSAPSSIGWAEEPAFVRQIRCECRPAVHADATGAWLLAPVSCGVEVGGVLWLLADAERKWTPSETAAFSVVAATLASLGGKPWRRAFEKGALDQRLEYAASLAGKLGHGFGNFLTGILGFTELSLNEVSAQTTLHTYLQEVWQSATQGAQWVHLLQLFSRKLAINPQPTPLGPIVHEEAARLKAVWNQVLSFTTDIPADLPAPTIDPDSLRKLLAHLLDNACESIRQAPGSVRLSARIKDLAAAECLDLIGACRPGQHLEIAIQDNGIGLSDDQRRKLFHEVFFSTKPRHRGMGVAVVYSLLKAYQGGIRYLQGEPRGTLAQIYLPRHRQTETPRELPLAGARILIVDTDPAVRDSVSRLFEANGAKTTACGNPHDALKAYTQPAAGFHLVLAEVLMPGMNGYDLAHRILERDPLANFMFVTDKPSMHGLANQDLARKYDLVRKPFDPPQLLQVIRGSLRRGLRPIAGRAH